MKILQTLSWLEHGATNTKIVGFIPVLAIHLTAGLDDPYESVPIQNILWIFCEVKSSIDCSCKKLSLGQKAQKDLQNVLWGVTYYWETITLFICLIWKMASQVAQWLSLGLFTDWQGSVPLAESPTQMRRLQEWK